MRRGFIDFSAPAFWVYVALAVYGAVHFVPLALSRFTVYPVAGIAAAAVWLAYAALLGWVLYRLEQFRRRSRVTIAGAFVWGAVVVSGIGVTASPAMAELLTNWLGEDNADWASALAASLVEEPLKVLGVFVLALIPATRINSALDGLFYGLFIGLGFEVAESFLYTMNAAAARDGAVEVVVGMLVLRGVIGGLWSHPTFSGITGAGAGYVFGPEASTRKKWFVFAGLLTISMLLHFFFDSPVFDGRLGLTTVFKGLPVLVVLVIAFRLARRRERALFEHAAATEIDHGLVSPVELETLLTRSGRRQGIHHAKASGGRHAAKQLEALQSAQIDLVEADIDFGRDSPEFDTAASRVLMLRSG